MAVVSFARRRQLAPATMDLYFEVFFYQPHAPIKQVGITFVEFNTRSWLCEQIGNIRRRFCLWAIIGANLNQGSGFNATLHTA